MIAAQTPHTITARERDTYEDIWSVPEYSRVSPGADIATFAVDLMGVGTVLDAGTGSGRGALALRDAGCDVWTCDLTSEGMVEEAREAFPFTAISLWDDLRGLASGRLGGKFDWVFCADVMEHLPKEYTLLAVVRMLEVSKRGVLIVLSNIQDEYGVFVGKALHQTVEDFTWWRDRLREVGEVTEARDMMNKSLFVVTPKGAR